MASREDWNFLWEGKLLQFKGMWRGTVVDITGPLVWAALVTEGRRISVTGPQGNEHFPQGKGRLLPTPLSSSVMKTNANLPAPLIALIWKSNKSPLLLMLLWCSASLPTHHRCLYREQAMAGCRCKTSGATFD